MTFTSRLGDGGASTFNSGVRDMRGGDSTIVSGLPAARFAAPAPSRDEAAGEVLVSGVCTGKGETFHPERGRGMSIDARATTGADPSATSA